ncbi:MAG TPA: hypothetical protein VN541_03360 [Tepidisphaeraceae bacterium]|nr:hypothetical protein [Tepidisphaeraceae bacterium]
MPKLENRFPTTRWSLVARAQDADPELRRQAMGQLLREYWRPLRGYLVAWGIREDRADDLVQGFIASRVIEQQLIDGAEAERGRFRTYLLTALRRYAANVIRDEQAAKRGGGVVLSLSQLGEPADCSTDPADAMDAAWARHVLRRAIDRMRFECERFERPGLWEMFECRVLAPALEGKPSVPYERLVSELQLESPLKASNLLVTAKRMFARCLRHVVSEYEADEAQVDQEIAELGDILARR